MSVTFLSNSAEWAVERHNADSRTTAIEFGKAVRTVVNGFPRRNAPLEQGGNETVSNPSFFVVVIVISFSFGALHFGLLFELGGSGGVGFGSVGEVVKKGNAVGFGPDADFAAVFEGIIFPGERLFAVESHDEEMIFEVNAEHVPLAGGDFGVDALLFGALAIDGVVDGDVVFQCVGAGNVIVVFVFAAPDDPAGLVLFAQDRFEFHFDETVLELRVVFDADRVRSLAGLFEDVGFRAG